MLGNLANHNVHLNLNTTLSALINGECKITPATSYFSAKYVDGPDPIDLPYNIIVSDGIFKFSVKYRNTVSISSYNDYSDGTFPLDSPKPVYSYTTALICTYLKKYCSSHV